MVKNKFIFFFIIVLGLLVMSGCSQTRDLSNIEKEYESMYETAYMDCVNHGQKYVVHYKSVVTNSDNLNANRWQVICYSESPVKHHTRLI